MNRNNRLTFILGLFLLTSALGCEAMDPFGDRLFSRDEIVGTVDRIDSGHGEVSFNTRGDRRVVVKYDASTVVINRGQQLQIGSLRYGDPVVVHLRRDSRGDVYADRIRVRD